MEKIQSKHLNIVLMILSQGVVKSRHSLWYKHKKVVFWGVIGVSIIISLIASIFFARIPSFSIIPFNKLQVETSIPEELVNELKNVSQESHVFLSQHGYGHTANIMQEEILKGYEILKNAGLNISYYTPPLEAEVAKNIPVPVLRSKFDFYEHEDYNNSYKPRIVNFSQGYVNFAETDFNEKPYVILKNETITYLLETTNTTTRHNLSDGIVLNIVRYNMKFVTENVSFNQTYYERDKMAVIHIQDDITYEWLSEIFALEDNISILRIDDVNANFVEGYGSKIYGNSSFFEKSLSFITVNIFSSKKASDEVRTEDQIKRIRIANSFCKEKGCELVFAIIPVAERIYKGDRGLVILSKTFSIITIMTLLPLYLFYLISFAIFKNQPRKINNGNNKKPIKATAVILPMYNEEKIIFDVLKKNIKAFETSDLKIKEIIIVDDCSKDNSVKEVKRFIKWYKGRIRIKIVRHAKNLGKSKALKTGIKHAKADYVLLTDSDSYFEKNALKEIVVNMNGSISLIGFVVPYETNLLSKMQAVEYDFDQTILRTTQSAYNNPISIPGPFCIVKKSFLKNANFSNSIVDDFKIGLALNRYNKKIEISKTKSYTHPPTNLGILRKQRLRWFGGIVYESLRNKAVWKKNGFYGMSTLLCFASFLFIIFLTLTFIVSFVLSQNKLLHLANVILFVIIFNTVIGLIYLLITKKWSLKLFLLFPYYLLFLFVIRTEVIFKLLFKSHFSWGTRSSKKSYI